MPKFKCTVKLLNDFNVTGTRRAASGIISPCRVLITFGQTPRQQSLGNVHVSRGRGKSLLFLTKGEDSLQKMPRGSDAKGSRASPVPPEATRPPRRGRTLVGNCSCLKRSKHLPVTAGFLAALPARGAASQRLRRN